MKLERDENGDFVIDPSVLTERLSVDAERFRRHMRMGLVTSVVESGTGDDEGCQRLTVRYGNAAWRAIIDADRNVLSEEVVAIGKPRPG
jgi:hypothetical protein